MAAAARRLPTKFHVLINIRALQKRAHFPNAKAHKKQISISQDVIQWLMLNYLLVYCRYSLKGFPAIREKKLDNLAQKT